MISKPGEGAPFEIHLPGADATVQNAENPPVSAGGPRGCETILVVEDNDQLRRFAVDVLKSYGYQILEAASGDEALLVAERHSQPIDLILTDVIMPEMTGKELADRLRALRPRSRVLYMSAHTVDHISCQQLLSSGELHIAKPFTPAALAAKVREALRTAARASVLVVDDEAGIRELFALTLAGAGYEVAEAEDGKAAMAVLGERRFDLLITDLVMPEREGIETIREVRKRWPDLKILAVSGAFGGAYLKPAKALGANATLPKPVSRDQLIASVRELLGG